MLSKEKLENYESEWKNAAPFIDPKADVVAEYLQSPSVRLLLKNVHMAVNWKLTEMKTTTNGFPSMKTYIDVPNSVKSTFLPEFM